MRIFYEPSRFIGRFGGFGSRNNHYTRHLAVNNDLRFWTTIELLEMHAFCCTLYTCWIVQFWRLHVLISNMNIHIKYYRILLYHKRLLIIVSRSFCEQGLSLPLDISWYTSDARCQSCCRRHCSIYSDACVVMGSRDPSTSGNLSDKISANFNYYPYLFACTCYR